MVNQGSAVVPNYEVTSPDGRTFSVTAPEGATHDQIIGYARTHMPAPTFIDTQKNVARGLGETGIGMAENAISGTLGLPADIINRVIHPSFGLPASPRPLPQVPGGSSQISNLLDQYIFGAPKTQQDVEARRAGAEMLLGVRPAASAAAMEAAATAAKAPRLSPLEKTIGTPTTPSAQGDILRTTIDKRLTEFEAKRAVATKPLYGVAESTKKALDDGVRTGAISDSEARHLQGIYEKQIARANTKYRELSAPINEFQVKLGKDLTGEAKDYAPGYSTDTSLLAGRAFRSRDSVRALKALSGGDTEWVEANARAYAATQLQKAIANSEPIPIFRAPAMKDFRALQAVEKWNRDNADWLKEVPGTAKAVQNLISSIKKTGWTKFALAYGGSGALLLFFMREGETPAYWLRHMLPVY